MLHKVHLPLETAQRLSATVDAQLALFAYASSLDGTVPNQVDCASSVSTSLADPKRGSDIAAWVWSGPTRISRLASFASGSKKEKQEWLDDIKADIDALSCALPTGRLHRLPKDPPAWLADARDLLVYFYTDVFGSGDGLPSYFVASDHRFGRQDFLNEFAKANGDLVVCPVCDAGGHATKLQTEIRSSIDHYFPKTERYPHLALHPYNLLPVCRSCNSATKGETDPLDTGTATLSLEDILLPYHDPLGDRSYLRLSIDHATGTANITDFAPRAPGVDLSTKLLSLAHTYKLPEIWSSSADQIGEQVFRRLRAYLGTTDPLTSCTPGWLLQRVDALIGFMFHDELGKDPNAFATTWWLATLAKNELVGGASTPNSAFADELRSLMHENAKQDYAAQGRRLRGDIP